MKGMMVRGVAGLAVALGLAACTNDDTVNAGGDFDKVQANPATLFVSIGDSTEVLVRLVDDLNRSTPTKFTVSNVGAGIAVNYDPRYRPDYTQGDTLVVPEIKPQQRYYVVGRANGLHEFTLTSGGASTTVRVYVTPDNLGAALSRTTGVAGDLVTITAPSGTKFSPTSAVTFASGPAPVITARAADGSTITMIVGPGVGGAATVTLVTYLFAPTAPAVTLSSSNTLTIPALTSIPLVYSTATPAPGQVVTVTAAGFKFRPTVVFRYGARAAFVLSVSADSSTATILVPTNLAAQTATVDNVALSFLTSVVLTGLGSTVAVTSGGYPTLPNTANPNPALAPTFAVAAAGTTIVITDAGAFTGADIIGGGGPLKWYRLTVAAAGTRTFRCSWNNGSDIDCYLLNAGATGFVNTAGGTAANPEVFSQALTAATNYWLVAVNYAGADPSELLISIK